MPTALMLTLRPTVAAGVPASLGRAAHAAILAQIAAADAALAARLHGEPGIKPLTVSNVLGLEGHSGRAFVTPGRTYGLRVTVMSEALAAIARGWSAAAMSPLMLDGLAWCVEGITAEAAGHPWAGDESYEALAAGALRLAAPPTQWTLEFCSPITFRHGAINQPLPLPELVFGSLLDKWNMFAPLPLPAELHSTIATLMVSRFDLRSLVTPTKGGALQIGAVGRCAYCAPRGDQSWLAGIDLVARFAFYSGVGAGTARGFGQTRLIAEEAQRRRPATHGSRAAAAG